VMEFIASMGVTPSRWVLVPAILLFLVSLVFTTPYSLQFYFRQRPFSRPENARGCIEDAVGF